MFCQATGDQSQSPHADVLSRAGRRVTRMTPQALQPAPGAAALCGALAMTLAIAGCDGSFPAYPQAPAPLAERVPEPPPSSQALSWRPGYWDWVGGSYSWVPGQWVPLAGHGAMWQDGYWVRIGFNSYQWIPPGWR